MSNYGNEQILQYCIFTNCFLAKRDFFQQNLENVMNGFKVFKQLEYPQNYGKKLYSNKNKINFSFTKYEGLSKKWSCYFI